MPRKSQSQRQLKANRETEAVARSVKRINITTKDGKMSEAVYAVGGQEGVFAVSCEPDRNGVVNLYCGDDGAWRYLTSYSNYWVKAIVYALSLAR